MVADGLLWAAAFAAIAGVVLLRTAWGRARRSLALNGAGWGILALAVLLAGAVAGAWGVAVAALCAMAGAFALLGLAAKTSPPARAQASNRRVAMLPDGQEPWRVGARVLTFVLVALLAAVSAIGVAVALRLFATWAGTGEADANALALLVMPLAWSLLTYFVLMSRGRGRQLLILGAVALPGIAALMGNILP